MISIIIPLYNKAQSIERAINSVIEQTYHDWELVIVDDGSSDDSALVVKKFSDKRIHYYYKTNGGVSSARNYGVTKALGDWILFLDADDYLVNNALMLLRNCQIQYGCFINVANFYVEFEHEKRLFNFTRDGVVTDPFKEWFFYRLHPRTGNTLIKKTVFDKINYNECLRRWEDADFCFKLLNNFQVAYIHEPVLVYTNDYKGLSYPSAKIEFDFVNYLQFKGSSFWYKMCQSVVLSNGLHRYKKLRLYLLKKYFRYLYLLIVKKVLLFLYK